MKNTIRKIARLTKLRSLPRLFAAATTGAFLLLATPGFSQGPSPAGPPTGVQSKTPAEYHIGEPVPPEKQQMLEQDKRWAEYPLAIPRADITVVKAAQMFETAQ